MLTPEHHAIEDSSAAGYFLAPGYQVINIDTTTKSLQIILPDGGKLILTYICQLKY